MRTIFSDDGNQFQINLNVSYWTKSEFDTDVEEQSQIKSYNLICPVLKVLLYIRSEQETSSEVLLFSFDFGVKLQFYEIYPIALIFMKYNWF
jgi:hypothetical protein